MAPASESSQPKRLTDAGSKAQRSDEAVPLSTAAVALAHLQLKVPTSFVCIMGQAQHVKPLKVQERIVGLGSGLVLKTSS